jgi:hypothetical protein
MRFFELLLNIVSHFPIAYLILIGWSKLANSGDNSSNDMQNRLNSSSRHAQKANPPYMMSIQHV